MSDQPTNNDSKIDCYIALKPERWEKMIMFDSRPLREIIRAALSEGVIIRENKTVH